MKQTSKCKSRTHSRVQESLFLAEMFIALILLMSCAAKEMKDETDFESTFIHTYLPLCSEWFRHRMNGTIFVSPGDPCEGYSTNDSARFYFVVNNVGHEPNQILSEIVPNVFPGPPIAAKTELNARKITDPSTGQIAGPIGFYPPVGDDYHGTWSTSYQLPPDWVYGFNLHPVPISFQEQMLSELASIERTKLYGVFGHKENEELPFLSPSDQFAHYARVYDISDDAVREGIYPLEYWEEIFKVEKPLKLWVECTIPVNEGWHPVGNPLRVVTPIALETTAGLYLVSQEVVRKRSYGRTVDHFEGPIFDLHGCEECFKSFMKNLTSELEAVFEKPPLSSTRIRKGMNPRHQIRFQREFERSNVLKGFKGPYYELSTYTLLIWVGPNGNLSTTAESYFTAGPIYDQVFLQVSHSLQIAVGREGDYVEPSVQQYAAYKREVTAAINNAISRAKSEK